jgi:hypothetical protein
MSLRKSLIKLAYHRPELRKHVLPLLDPADIRSNEVKFAFVDLDFSTLRIRVGLELPEGSVQDATQFLQGNLTEKVERKVKACLGSQVNVQEISRTYMGRGLIRYEGSLSRGISKGKIATSLKAAENVFGDIPLNIKHASPSFMMPPPNRPYYTIRDESLREIARKWAEDGKKAHEARVNGYYPVEELWKYREYTWTRDTSRAGTARDGRDAEDLAGPLKWDAIKEDMQRNGWRLTEQALTFQVDKEGFARVAEGNHRLAIARELGMKEVPVTFEFVDKIWAGGTKIV